MMMMAAPTTTSTTTAPPPHPHVGLTLTGNIRIPRSGPCASRESQMRLERPASASRESQCLLENAQLRTHAPTAANYMQHVRVREREIIIAGACSCAAVCRRSARSKQRYSNMWLDSPWP
jgi:hypothetical protein